MIDCPPDVPGSHPGVITVIQVHDEIVEKKPASEFPPSIQFHRKEVSSGGQTCVEYVPVITIRMHFFDAMGKPSGKSEARSILIQKFDKDSNQLSSTKMKKE